MPRYHFNIHDPVGGTSSDWEGTEFPDAATAEQEAVRFAGDTIADNALLKRYSGKWHLEVTDHAGAPIFYLDFLIRAAAVSAALHEPLTSAASVSTRGSDPRGPVVRW